MLGLRLDEPLQLNGGLTTALDADAVDRLSRSAWSRETWTERTLALTERGRFLGGRVTAELLA